ncbi:hypothetical protein FRB95_004175 [Tulasnella sp. JGI-2019a]|nr:hypothetical protein FRB95_004175 [Tulasnella sp. JGI-2019a]
MQAPKEEEKQTALQIRTAINNALASVKSKVWISGAEYTNGGNMNLYAAEPASAKDLLPEVERIMAGILPEDIWYWAELDEVWWKMVRHGVSPLTANGKILADHVAATNELLESNPYIK